MIQAQIERVSVRTALAIGFCVTLGLWLYTGYAFNQRINAVQQDAANVAAQLEPGRHDRSDDPLPKAPQ